MQYGLGVDLGTTQTAAAVLTNGRVEVVRLGGRRPEIPSLVFVKPDGGLLIGEAAERRGQTEPARLAREFKRRMGDPVPILVGGTPFSAHALTGKLLRHVLETVVQAQGDEPAAITVTHPANWGPYKREQLDQAIRLADAGRVQTRSEPEAAALQHATARRIAPGETVAVYDLGGGTFDAAVLRREGDGFVLLGEPEGVEQLGGSDFDEAVFGYVLGVLGNKADSISPDDPEAVAALARLRRDCVEAKESLSFDTETMIPVALPGLHTRVRLNRSELEAMIAPSLADTVTAMQRALRAAGVTPDQLSAILLAGGSSRIPLVSELLSTKFQRPVVGDPHPEHSIAMGAAVSTAAALGSGSPFPGAVPMPRPSSDLAGVPSIGAGLPPARAGLPPTGTGVPPTGAGPPVAGNAAVRPPAGGTAPISGAGPVAPPFGSSPFGSPPGGNVAPGRGPVSFSRGAAAVPGTTPPAGPAGTPGTPGGIPGVAGNGAADLPGGTRGMAGNGAAGLPGGTHGMAGNGAAGVPGNGAPAAGGGHAAGVPGNGGTTMPWPPPPLPAPAGGEKRNVGKVVTYAALAVALLAGGTTAVLLAINARQNATQKDAQKDAQKDGAQETATTAPQSAAARDGAAPLPTDTMLIRVDPAGAEAARESKIYTLTPGNSGRKPLLNTKAGDVLPKWSHTRKQIALTGLNKDGTTAIFIMNADGSDRRKLVDGGGRPAWSADDKKIAFVRWVDKVPQLFVVTVASRAVKQLTHSPILKDDAMWSPDGASIVYWLNKDGIKQIYELDVADPKEPGRQIVGPQAGPANDPVYSPDGKQVLYTRDLDAGTTSDIWLVNVDGSNPHRVTDNPAREVDPTWSPDGRWLAFMRGEFSDPTIVVQRLDGTGEMTLTAAGQREGHPCWF